MNTFNDSCSRKNFTKIPHFYFSCIAFTFLLLRILTVFFMNESIFPSQKTHPFSLQFSVHKIFLYFFVLPTKKKSPQPPKISQQTKFSPLTFVPVTQHPVEVAFGRAVNGSRGCRRTNVATNQAREKSKRCERQIRNKQKKQQKKHCIRNEFALGRDKMSRCGKE